MSHERTAQRGKNPFPIGPEDRLARPERFVIRAVEGTGVDLLSQKGSHDAFLGVSLGKNFFSKQHIAMYSDWALEWCDRFLIVIDDREERYNYQVFRGFGPAESTTRSLERGKEVERAFRKVLPHFGNPNRDRITLIRSATLFEVPACAAIAEGLVSNFHSDPKFHDDVISQMFTNIGSRIEKWKEGVSEEIYAEGLERLANYLLEEIAVTAYLREHGDYAIEVYPGPSLRVVKKLYDGLYPELSKQLELREKHGYIYLDIE